VPKAKWTAGTPTKSVDANGTINLAVPLLDNGTRLGEMRLSLTADYVLRFDWKQDPGVTPNITLAAAWSNV
jgi:hypothetical protein